MIRYLSTYTDEERWLVLKAGEVKTVRDLIEGVEDLYQKPTFENVERLNELEKEHAVAISELDASDQFVLEETLHKVYQHANELLYDNYSKIKFLKERVAFKGLTNELDPIFKWFDKGQDLINAWTSYGPIKAGEMQTEDFMDEAIAVWKEKGITLRSDLYDLLVEQTSPAWMEFILDCTEQEQTRLDAHIRHLEKNEFGQWLSSVRDELGWSLAKASNTLKISREQISAMEDGTFDHYQLPLLIKLATGYQIPIAQLLHVYSSPIQSLDELVREHTFSLYGNRVNRKQKQIFVEMIEAVLQDDLVEAHQKLDDFAYELESEI